MLLGVMSNPAKPLLRTQWREWGGRFSSYQQSVRVRYVFGTSFYEAGKEHGRPTRNDELAREEREHGDMIYVDGRERLPHVGVVTEKSGWWGRAVADRRRKPTVPARSDQIQ